ncbi:unnamed protein product, partial [Brassica oleracea var. botrytis]
ESSPTVLGCEPSPCTRFRAHLLVYPSGEARPTTRLPREPGTRTIFTNRRTTPSFHPPSHQNVDLRWRRYPTEPRAIAVKGVPE